MTRPSPRRLDRDVLVVRVLHPRAPVAARQMPKIDCRRLTVLVP